MTECDHQRLVRLLDDSLPESMERAIEEHVSICPACQSELESLAAGREWWDEASQRLSKSSHVSLVSSRAVSDISHKQQVGDGDSNLPDADEHDHFAADFAVDFLEPGDDPAMLGRLGEYDIVQVIGRGGMGIVLKGYQKELQRFVAVKVLSPHLSASAAARRRFAREAQATAAIVHPHVMAIHSVQANVKLPYLVMPFVACESLQDRLDRQGPLDTKDVLRIGMQAALGLSAAHAQGLVHRDVKPANILLETTVDRVMLTDFGLARAVDDATLTRTGIIAGTPQYMSPEQANGDAVDHRSDLFSLGGVLYAMCTGRPPFRAETTFGVLRRIRESPPRPLREINADVPEWLDRFVMRLLSKEPAHRVSTANDVASVLQQCLAHLQQPTAIPLPIEMEIVEPRSLPVKPKLISGKTVVLSSLVVAASVILIAAILRHDGSRTADDQSNQARTNVPQSAPVEPTIPSIDPILEWNTFQRELNSASKMLEPLEASAAQDLEPSSTHDDSTDVDLNP